MSVLSRDIDQVNIEEAYENSVRTKFSLGRSKDSKISARVIFPRYFTLIEQKVRNNGMKVKKQQED